MMNFAVFNIESVYNIGDIVDYKGKIFYSTINNNAGIIPGKSSAWESPENMIEIIPVTRELISSMYERGEVYHLITKEVKRAESLHPNFPVDLIHRAGIVAEESGELMQAAIDHIYAGKERDKAITEAIHTAATCIRFLIACKRDEVVK